MEGLLPMHHGLDRSVVTEIAQKCASAGMGRLWVSELRGADPFVLATLLRQAAPELPTGTCIASLYARSDRATAAAAAALADPGFVLGLGVSNRSIAAWHGRAWEPPSERVGAAVSTIRALLGGGRDTTGPSLWWSLDEPPPIVLASVSARGVALASEHCDGLVLNLLVPEAAARSAETFRAGTDRPVWCVLRVTAHERAPSPEWQAWLDKELGTYAQAPGYKEAFASAGDSHDLVARGPEEWRRLSDALRSSGIEPIALPLVAPFEPVLEPALAAFGAAAG
jgi:alkanesulfonate monooxygenase SsuD/methylene tetrahydromethanopterin reductase-like flavin-dependent oxidoreductase (luciferase family)